MDSFTERSYTGYGQNIGNSFKGMIFGLALIVGSIILLWWNESRSLKQATALQEMQEKIITLPDTIYNTGYEGQAVLLQGLVKPLNELIDTEFNVKSSGLVLRKNVTMFQWRENKTTHSEDKLGGGTETVTTYDYVQEWSSSAINSSSFKHTSGHQNPPMHYKSHTFSTNAMLGDYSLDKQMVQRISASTPFNGLAQMPEYIGVAENHQSFLYIGHSTPNSPQIGDVKIHYTYAPSDIYTYASKVLNKSLVPYRTTNGKSFAFVRVGKVEANTIFEEELDANSVLTWILRGVGLFLMFIGFNAIIAPLATLAKVIPMLGDVVGGIGGLFAGILTLILGTFVIALAWFGARPLLSIGLIAGAVLISFILGKRGKKEEVKEDTFVEDEVYEKQEHTSTPPSRRTPPPRR